MLVGEHPGAEEDLIGEPFSDRAGALLKKLLADAGIASYYATYAVKCWPNGKVPRKAERVACSAWLWAELRSVNPRVVISLGRVPSRLLLGKQIVFEDVLGTFQHADYMKASVAVWHSASHILSRGKKVTEETVSFFKSVLEKTTCSDS
jgi:DNA polymerase